MTMAPLIANGVLITGMSGAESASAASSTAGRAERQASLAPLHHPRARRTGQRNLAAGLDAWQHGGGSAWITGSYDPELDLTYWGIGNPAPWASQSRPGDNLYTSSLLAIRPKTGEIAWHYSSRPAMPMTRTPAGRPILADIDVEGVKRKGGDAAQPATASLCDRSRNGKLISAKPYAKVELGQATST